MTSTEPLLLFYPVYIFHICKGILNLVCFLTDHNMDSRRIQLFKRLQDMTQQWAPRQFL